VGPLLIVLNKPAPPVLAWHTQRASRWYNESGRPVQVWPKKRWLVTEQAKKNRGYAEIAARNCYRFQLFTFDRDCVKGSLDWMSLKEIWTFVENCHKNDGEDQVTGSITNRQPSNL